jgi:glutamate-5-semialdehyde dehydrogenase
MQSEPLNGLQAGDRIVIGGDRYFTVDEALAERFQPGDRLLIAGEDIVHITAEDQRIARDAVDAATRAFAHMGATTDEQITAFFNAFADRLDDDAIFAAVDAANQADVARAAAAGRSTTRLVLSPKMRGEMIDGLRSWAVAPSGRDAAVETIEHAGWTVSQRRAGLGPVGFIFEGRPNVFADATGVLRSGNTVVFRIGSDALGTATAIVEHCLNPAIEAAGLPEGCASLVASLRRGAGSALFADPRLALAVARGSGPAVAQLGAIARAAGTAVSLHGTGGAWLVVHADADAERTTAAIENSLDRKVCNTVNTIVVYGPNASGRLGDVCEAVANAATRLGTAPRFHATHAALDGVPPHFRGIARIHRAEGEVEESQTTEVAIEHLGEEWEWEQSPEVSLVVTDTLDEAITLLNRYSPQFVASIITPIGDDEERFYQATNVPFFGNGFTRWVDGQYAFNRPELGLSNWQFGRLFGRGGVLSGDSVFTLRTRVDQQDPHLRR